jgi:hypothetical protein
MLARPHRNSATYREPTCPHQVSRDSAGNADTCIFKASRSPAGPDATALTNLTTRSIRFCIYFVRLNDPGLNPGRDRRFIFTQRTPIPVLGYNQPRCESDYSFPSTFDVRNKCSLPLHPSLPLYAFMVLTRANLSC